MVMHYSPTMAHAIGREAEARVLRILRESEWPDWCVGPHDPATPNEDRSGIDIVVRLDTGPVFVQVKASRKTAKKLAHRYTCRGIIVVWAGSEFTDVVIRDRLLVEMRKARAKRLDRASYSHVG
jgi:hypothetical protein